MVAIEDYKISPTKKIIDDINIQIIYLPLESKMGYIYKPTVKVNEYVMIGSIVGTSNITDIPLISSISGTVVGLEDKYISNGKLVKCIVIENDFKEKYLNKLGKKGNIANTTKEEFIYTLKKCAITGMYNSDYPTYLKYETNKKMDYLIVNGCECEIFSSSDSARMYNNPEEILEVIDAIVEIMGMEKAYIAISDNNEIVIKKILRYINTYPNIKIFPVTSGYPNGYGGYLINTIVGENKRDKVIVENVATIYAIYEALKYNKPLVDRIVTISGDGIKKPANYNLKIGTNFNEILLKSDIVNKKDNLSLIAGGLMMGTSIPNDNLIVTKSLGTILMHSIKTSPSYDCLKCGKCNEVCPVNLLPALLIDRNSKNEKLRIDTCIDCGLCSYVCPSKIEVRELIRKMKEGIK